MQLRVTLSAVQHIGTLDWTFELDRPSLTVIVGRNGCGKTTLAKALLTIQLADTYAATSSAGIVAADTTITYAFDEEQFAFTYDARLGTLNSKRPIPPRLKSLVGVELPIPHGERFKFFRTIGESDHDIRLALAVGRGTPRVELNEFLGKIYSTERFKDLLEITIGRRDFYCFRMAQSRYLREDFLSSGEYFLIGLYRRIVSGKKLLFIDEIDISLDADAQARLARELRTLCGRHGVHLVCTTHSMAMMSTLESGELLFMENQNGAVSFRAASYNYARTLMFGLHGWDKYILTEDDMLADFLRYVIERDCTPTFYQYQVIFIGGSGNVSSLMMRNRKEQFFGPEKDVISVLDGDQAHRRAGRRPNTLCLPFKSVEKALLEQFHLGGLTQVVPLLHGPFQTDGKKLLLALEVGRHMNRREVFELLYSRHETSMAHFAGLLGEFLGGKVTDPPRGAGAPPAASSVLPSQAP